MNRTIAVYRLVFVVGVVSLLVGVVALSTTTRRPFLRPCTGLWHTCKAGHLSESEQHRSSVTKANNEVAEDLGAEAEAAPTSYVPCEEVLPRVRALVVSKHHFRSPPPVL